MRTQVCITVDTEFSIGGAFADAARQPVAAPAVWCQVNGRSEGLGFMLETFRRYQVQATFFVETVHRYHFSDDPMRPIVQRLQDENHEVQLHTHPCWSVFRHPDWTDRVRAQRQHDDFLGRTVDDSVALIEQGLASFRDWGLPRPQAFRSGNLQHDDNLYQALARTGIPYSSNVGLAIFDSGDARYALYSGRHERHGVAECPVLTYSDMSLGTRPHLKALTIIGTSFAETRALLEKAHQAQIALVVVLTHPFEFVQRHDVGFHHMRRHRLTQDRLTRLCAYLQRNGDRFEASGFARAAGAAPVDDKRNLRLESPLWRSLPRMATQVAYDRFGNWALARTQG